MSEDTREDILSYLHEGLLPNISGIKSTWRNRGGLDDIERPAVILLDGKEFIFPPFREVPGRKTVKMPPVVMTLKPQIFIVLQLRDNVTNMTLNNAPDPVGPELSAWRMKVKAAIENDPTLIGLLTDNGQITYCGCDTDMQTGSSIGALGAMLQFDYEFNYVLFPPRS